MIEHYPRPAGLPAPNGYSHVVAFAGRCVAVSGQVPLDADGNVVGPGDPEAQAEQVFRNLGTALAAAGATFADVVKLTVFLTDLADLPAFRAVRDRYVNATAPPASSLVRVVGLVHPAFRVEIDALAVVGDHDGR
ncbi:RidA family protein [Dactylosporangium sp. NPDC048998]|uniref:RidA family protein n=1 Tax=Dactylosporangium sp. NPDC048998 TaxID=3363976 RepID=UPI003712B927